MNTEDQLSFLKKAAYLDDVIHDFRDHHDPSVLLLLIQEQEYADILVNKFFYPSKKALLNDATDFDRLNRHIDAVTSDQNYWFNCIRHGNMHTTHKIRFLFVYSGQCVCRYGDTVAALRTGDTCIVPAGTEFSHDGLGADCYLIHAHISPRYFQQTLMNKLPRSGAVPITFFQNLLHPQYQTVQIVKNSNLDVCRSFMLNALYESQYKKLYYYESLESYLVLFITELFRTITVSVETDLYARSSEEKRIMDIRRYIDRNRQNVNLSDTAAHFHYTPGYLSQFISRITGQTFTQLVQESRLQEASRLLLHTTMSISEITNVCGYQNTSYFYRIFQKKFECTPLVYRQKNYGIENGTPMTDNTLPK